MQPDTREKLRSFRGSSKIYQYNCQLAACPESCLWITCYRGMCLINFKYGMCMMKSLPTFSYFWGPFSSFSPNEYLINQYFLRSVPLISLISSDMPGSLLGWQKVVVGMTLKTSDWYNENADGPSSPCRVNYSSLDARLKGAFVHWLDPPRKVSQTVCAQFSNLHRIGSGAFYSLLAQNKSKESFLSREVDFCCGLWRSCSVNR